MCRTRGDSVKLGALNVMQFAADSRKERLEGVNGFSLCAFKNPQFLDDRASLNSFTDSAATVY
jgi:hypothetical protein